MKIKNLKMTCGACPSQWEGELVDGRQLYIRYRWGYLSVRVSDGPTDNAVGGEEIFGQEVGDDLDGCMTTEEMQKHTKGVIDWVRTSVSYENE